jgi:hypothetical protein
MGDPFLSFPGYLFGDFVSWGFTLLHHVDFLAANEVRLQRQLVDWIRYVWASDPIVISFVTPRVMIPLIIR